MKRPVWRPVMQEPISITGWRVRFWLWIATRLLRAAAIAEQRAAVSGGFELIEVEAGLRRVSSGPADPGYIPRLLAGQPRTLWRMNPRARRGRTA